MLTAKSDVRRIHPAVAICFTLMAMGVVVRTTNYFLADISFWNDEVAIAQNIIGRNFLEFFRPLDFAQVAPIGFCLFEKSALLLLGNNEMSFRLISFLAGVSTIGLVFLFVQRSVGFLPALLCAAQLAVIKEPIYFSNELKPYASDLAIAVGLMLLAWKDRSTHWSLQRYLVVAFAGALAVWFSFPAIFILGGIGALWSLDWLEKPDKKRFWGLISIFVFWLASFWWHFQFLQTNTNNDYLQTFWGSGFMPLPPKSIDDLKFFLNLPYVFRTPLWTSHPMISVVLFVGGCLVMWKFHRRLLLMILFPLFLNLAASGLHKYPFGDRLLLYGTLNLFIPIAVFLVFLLSRWKDQKVLKAVVVLLIIANLAEPAVNVVKDIFRPDKLEQMKQTAERLANHEDADRPYYVFGSSYRTFQYYMERFQLEPQSVIVGPGVEVKNPDKIKARITGLAGDVWLVFGHGKQSGGVDYERMYLEAANSEGRLLDQIEYVGAAAYLYRFPL